jgi:hypothetical protein
MSKKILYNLINLFLVQLIQIQMMKKIIEQE